VTGTAQSKHAKAQQKHLIATLFVTCFEELQCSRVDDGSSSFISRTTK
jgi:hypothetical protein